MHAVRRDPFGPIGVFGSCGTQHDQIGLGFFQAAPVVGEHLIGTQTEVGDHRLHAVGLFVADADDLDIGMLERHPQVIAHVHVIEIDTGNSVFRH